MDAQRDNTGRDGERHSPRRLLRRVLRVMKRHTDDPSAADPGGRRIDSPTPDTDPGRSPRVQRARTWSQIGARPIRSKGHQAFELPDSRAEPGGVPVYVDPDMVTPAAAEKMRPLFRR
jgi:hypothetical protein